MNKKLYQFEIIPKKNHTWGYTYGLYFQGKKIYLASGCGYCKVTACVENAIKHATGIYVSLGGYENEKFINDFLKTKGIPAKYKLVYNGDNEIAIEIEVKSK